MSRRNKELLLMKLSRKSVFHGQPQHISILGGFSLRLNGSKVICVSLIVLYYDSLYKGMQKGTTVAYAGLNAKSSLIMYSFCIE